MHSLGSGVPAGSRTKWLVTPKPDAAAGVRLVCFPSAGHGPAMFRSWLPLLPTDVELSIAHLPGRESRWNEPSMNRIEEVAPALAEAIAAEPQRRFALFGHSLGALVAFGVARRLRATHGLEPIQFFASAHRGPQLPLRYPKIAGMDDRSFVHEVNARHGGIPPEVADNRELMELMVPSLKADYRLFEEYAHVDEPPLECPLSAFGGTQDRYVTEPDLQAWREQTSGTFRLRMIDGGHFFVNELRPSVVASVVSDLKGATA